MSRPPHRIAVDVIRRERQALESLEERVPALAAAFDQAVEAILACSGRVILCGIGKSGHIGRKIASTLVSTGTPAAFLHPAEGFHGDVGLVTDRDIVVVLSNSGETREILDLVPIIRSLGARVIALTGRPDTSLVRAADLSLCWGELEEVDPTGLVPTASAVTALALGDALTVAVMDLRGFGRDSYRLFHPRGAIGTRLTLRVVDLLRGPNINPTVGEQATFREALDMVTRSTRGGVSIVDAKGRLVGILTDGDVRRAIQVADGDVTDLLARPIRELMTRDPVVTSADTLAIDALRIMEEHEPRPIYLLPVVDAARRPVGMLHLHTLVQAGLSSGV